ncbi:MAG: c-type cytochrome [Gammaproteobacteria bacterium]|nr:c-type cytochrome [Gammaproteobacteria bacterium]
MLILSFLCALAVAGFASAQTHSVWDGVYSEEQARRGAILFGEVCASCHGEDLRGDSNSPGLIGVSFMFLWEDRSLGELFRSIQSEMPPTNPNSLARGSYLDILAYIMNVNTFPAGEDKLSPEFARLDQIFITPKP